MGSWYNFAKRLEEKDYDIECDFDEEFFTCPECCEPIYADDWEPEDLIWNATDTQVIYRCPICEERF